ncbi:MAG: PEGA domain-containing protein [Thermoanaerobaculaceae bacterium]|nr:PEGA domain-containing protein [Thermoanaerobaculaceae bacterium]TAM46931.1 MAG: PEGA domain-containing protein [Acidobacteriota bacterium]
MGCFRWLGVFLVTCVPAAALAGDIQVTCEPGLRVYLDGTLVGASGAKDDGLFLANVENGAHVVRVEKEGFVPQSFQVEVRDLPIEVRVEKFLSQAVPRGGAAGARKVKPPAGSLLVTSAPQNCVVEIDGKTEEKSVPVLRLDGLEAGEHAISFSKGGYARLSGVVKILPGAEVRIRGDLLTGTLATVDVGEGSLRVLSVPEYCTVRFLGKTREKTGLNLNVSHVPVGEQRIVVLWRGRELTSSVAILKGQRAIVTVSFMKDQKPFAVAYEPE